MMLSEKLSRSLTVAIAVALWLGGCATQTTVLPKEPPPNITVKRLLNAIDEAARLAHLRFGERFSLELSKAFVTLTTTTSRSRTGGLELWIFTLDHTRTKSSTQTVTVTLKPPKTMPSGATTTFEPKQGALSAALSQAFEEGMLAAQGARDGLSAIHADGIPLEASTIGVEISFWLTRDNEGEPSISLTSVDLTGDRTVSGTGTHTISLTFTVLDSDRGATKKS